ncbi:suppressor of lurcher protein 1-like isoform X3 [Mercenaria mercenaria]|uniref:suppressor of lurcher protein 1-like isoform X3 n=1 Tax=Mercenaria mercenaria TaxID=6596 RepID=UPI00234EAA55|nr:suppressor of lurcher protein 1-like isoform X3 [Mercenaria mercenaria]
MVYWYESLFLYTVSFLVQTQGIDPSREACLNFESEYHQPKACECVTFQSYGLSTGQFHSPDYPKAYGSGINCILFNFVGDVNEIVEIKFLAMDLKGPVHVRPDKEECRDWLRIYKNLDRGEINENVKHQDELCGNLSNLKEKVFYSSGRALIMEFHTDPDSREKHTGFKGVFTFLEKNRKDRCGSSFDRHVPGRCSTGIFKTVGILRYGTQCSYDIQSGNNHTKGKFFSPRYPQRYPKSSDCVYMFMGHDNEHVKVLFKLIQLPKHSSGCDENGDIIRVYDGRDKSSPMLKTFCDNTHNQVELYSTGPYMYIEFHSDRHHEAQGFAADYEFLDKRWEGGSSPVPSDNGMSESPDGDSSAMIRKFPYLILKCNESISSKDKKNGTIKNQFYSSGIICQYDFKAEGQERIQLKFTSMDLFYSAGDPNDPFECPSQDSITVYTYKDGEEQELGQFCGKKHPQQLMSSGQRMRVLFKSMDNQKDSNSGFRIEYNFRTDFGVQGNGVQDNREVCTFMFRSTLHTTGYFTSPNYGGQYPRNTECTYIFTGRLNEVVEIEFPEFDVDGIIPRCDNPTDSDYVAFSNFLNTEDRQMRRYCGNRPSYPTVTSDAAFFRVTFRSNSKFDANGFRGRYKFKRKEETPYVTAPPSETPQHVRSNGGSRPQVDITVSIATIIFFCKSVIDHLLNVF